MFTINNNWLKSSKEKNVDSESMYQSSTLLLSLSTILIIVSRYQCISWNLLINNLSSISNGNNLSKFLVNCEDISYVGLSSTDANQWIQKILVQRRSKRRRIDSDAQSTSFQFLLASPSNRAFRFPHFKQIYLNSLFLFLFHQTIRNNKFTYFKSVKTKAFKFPKNITYGRKANNAARL